MSKEVSLGTSKNSYMDPRVIFAWCKKYGIPFKKVYSDALVEKFFGAMALIFAGELMRHLSTEKTKIKISCPRQLRIVWVLKKLRSFED